MLTKGGRVRDKSNEMGFRVPKMCVNEEVKPTLPYYMLRCPKQPKGFYNVISKSVFSLNALVEGGPPNADEG